MAGDGAKRYRKWVYAGFGVTAPDQFVPAIDAFTRPVEQSGGAGGRRSIEGENHRGECGHMP